MNSSGGPECFEAALGPRGGELAQAFRQASDYLRGHDRAELLAAVGQTIESLPEVEHLGKALFQASFRTGATTEGEDLLAGHDLFFITERRRLFLDTTAGHYQMTWGYNHARLTAALLEAVGAGLVWDDHSNIPGDTVKRLAEKLVELANGVDSTAGLEDDPKALNTVLLGIATGSVACAASIKMALNYSKEKGGPGEPVFVTLVGNYHGTDMVAQRLRGMWAEYLAGVPVEQVEPNDVAALRRVFEDSGDRIAAMFVEPVMMNREAILLDREYLLEARRLCDEHDCALVFDEIQTGFWYPEIFAANRLGIVPDMLIAGKGMTAGFHPLSAVIYRRKYDSLTQYDAISTNGNAPLAAYMALHSITLIKEEGERIARVARYYREGLQELPREFPRLITCIHGDGLLAGIKFHTVQGAKEFHRRCLDAGIWLRLHVYHEGHSTALTKFALSVNEETVDFLLGRFREILSRLG